MLLKNNCIKYLTLFSVLPLVCFCTNESVQPRDIVTINASIPETKVSISPGTDPALTLAWEDTDQIVVKGSSESVFSIKEIKDAHNASFQGESVTGSSFSVYYPSADILTRSYEGQVQDGDASTAHLAYNAMVSDLTSYSNFTFDKVNGAVKLVVRVPSSVTEVSSISITSQDSDGAPQSVFYKTNDPAGERTSTLRLDFSEGTTATAGVLTAYEMVSWNEVELAANSRLAFKLTVPGKSCSYQKTIKLTKAATVAGGKTFIVDLSGAAEFRHHIAGSGTEGDPYLLYDVEDLKEMDGLLEAGAKKYFKLMADVDMGGVTDWVASNQTEPYSEAIDFDGNNHTISNFTFDTTGQYAGFIGVLNGRVANLTFSNPTITASKAAGVVCGYAGTTGTANAVIENVNVVNGSVTQNGNAYTGLIFGTSGVAGTFTNCHTSGTVTVSSSAAIEKTKAASGGVAGSCINSTFSGCSFTGTINGARLTGGIVGFERDSGSISECWTDATIKVTTIHSITAEIAGGIVGYLTAGSVSNCYSKGSITVASQIAGGIVGEVYTSSTVSNCWSMVTIKAQRVAGGIIGRACNGGWTNTSNKCLTLSSCVYWGSKIDVASAGTGNGSSGSIVGYTTIKNVLQNCWRIPDASFTFVNTNNTLNTPIDQPDCNGSNWVRGSTPQVGTGSSPQQYLFPYWGKASSSASISATVSDKNLGWSTTIWDFSEGCPTLKNMGDSSQEGGYPDVPDTPDAAWHSFVRPSGAGWTKTAVMDGIDLYSFVGTDNFSHKAQSVYIADVDLSKYDLKFACDGSKHITSDILNMYPGAVIAMNGAYETSAIYIKNDGVVRHQIAYDFINGTSVPNWKNDGAICKKTDGSLCIINTIFREADARGCGSYGLSLETQRNFYRSSEMNKYTDVFSSSPLLIDNYNPLGESYLPVEDQSLSESALQKKYTDSEHPYHHQGSTHPRTAIALTSNNHLLMIAADGRFSKADGFSSKTLTSFLVDAFDPRYAINMDGGGSTTLCVAGRGDATTHVVNHPYDNYKYDHAGERSVSSHFYVVKK